jgi:hypothetical protein
MSNSGRLSSFKGSLGWCSPCFHAGGAVEVRGPESAEGLLRVLADILGLRNTTELTSMVVRSLNRK